MTEHRRPRARLPWLARRLREARPRRDLDDPALKLQPAYRSPNCCRVDGMLPQMMAAKAARAGTLGLSSWLALWCGEGL